MQIPFSNILKEQFAFFKRLSYCFEETIGFDVKVSFASRPVSRLISWYNNQAIQFHGTFHGLKITNWEFITS